MFLSLRLAWSKQVPGQSWPHSDILSQKKGKRGRCLVYMCMCLSFTSFLAAGEAIGFEEDVGRDVRCFWKEALGVLGHPPKGAPRGRRSTQSEVRVGSLATRLAVGQNHGVQMQVIKASLQDGDRRSQILICAWRNILSQEPSISVRCGDCHGFLLSVCWQWACLFQKEVSGLLPPEHPHVEADQITVSLQLISR